LKKAEEAHRMAAELTQVFAHLIGRIFNIQDIGSNPMAMPTSSSKSRSSESSIPLPPSHTLILGHYLSKCVERVVACRHQLAAASKEPHINTDSSGEGIILAMRSIERKMREKHIRLLCETWIHGIYYGLINYYLALSKSIQ
jgi:hypothetical protein